MQVIKSTKIIYYDVDDTLIMWDLSATEYESSNLIRIVDPASGVSRYCLPHQRHIDLMQEFKVRGHTIVVWSQGGSEWAHRAVVALGIENLVDVVIGKPDWYVDDRGVESWMKKPVYLHPTDPLKDKRWGVENEDS
jgi:hypothetical protein